MAFPLEYGASKVHRVHKSLQNTAFFVNLMFSWEKSIASPEAADGSKQFGAWPAVGLTEAPWLSTVNCTLSNPVILLRSFAIHLAVERFLHDQ